jgi:glycosyltransferase involved in cell wall biosynthesis
LHAGQRAPKEVRRRAQRSQACVVRNSTCCQYLTDAAQSNSDARIVRFRAGTRTIVCIKQGWTTVGFTIRRIIGDRQSSIVKKKLQRMTLPNTPRASLILLAYNQEHTVRRAAESCLAQQCEPIEIVLSDDASNDRTFAILHQLASDYRGPHRVRARRNATNVGIGEHYNQLLAATSGELLITAAGDDYSLPHRVDRLLAAWDASGRRADLVASHVVDLDHEDRLHDVIRVDDLSVYRNARDWAQKRPYIIGAGHAFTRRMMRRFGPFAEEVFYEDQVMVFRAITSGGGLTVDEPLVHYRRGGTSRRPDFESVEAKRRWTARQRARETAEMYQLIADSRIAGCEQMMRVHLGKAFTESAFLDRIKTSSSSADLWAAYQEAASLPRAWRLRKISHVAYPRASRVVRSMCNEFHAWRHSLGTHEARRVMPPKSSAHR